MIEKTTAQELSPYCSRCSLRHVGLRHQYHETNEHDDWLKRMARANLKKDG